MVKLWLSKGILSLLIALGILIDQGLRYGVWWEWEDFLHHETFISIFFYASIVLMTVALVEKWKLKRERE